MEDRPVKFTQRSGTIDLGRQYELKIPALLALRCIENPKVKDAWFASNVKEAYDFDDVILYVEDEKNSRSIYLMQLKHSENPKTLQKKEFSLGAKRQKNKKEDVSLYKYERSHFNIRKSLTEADEDDGFVTVLRNADKIYYVLYTNRPLHAEYEFLYVREDAVNLLNTSESGRNVYGFSSESFDLDDQFLSCLQLFTQQAHVTKLDELIKNELIRIAEAVNIVSINANNLLQKYLDFVQTSITVANNSVIEAITKNEVMAQLLSFILDDYLVRFPLKTPCRAQFSTWNEITHGKALIVVEATKSTREFLTSYLSTKFAEYCDINNWNQEFSKSILYEKNPDLEPTLMKTVGARGLTAEPIHKALWLHQKVPLLVEAKTSCDLERIQAALQLSQNNNYSVIVLISLPAAPKCLLDLRHFDKKHQNLILNHPITLQGRPGFCLQDIVDESTYEFIRCKDIIDIISNLYNIGNTYATGLQFYLPRVISKVLFTTQELNKINLRVIGRTTSEQKEPEKIILEGDKDHHELNWVHGNVFELKPSHTNTRNLREHQVIQLQTLDESDCWWLPPNEMKESACVINAHAGMGKTELFNHLALTAPPSIWVVKVNLNDHHNYYKTIADSNNTALDHLHHFYSTTNSPNHELTKRVFLKFVEQKRILVLLDGFDEISTTYKLEVTSIATSLHQSGYKIWVSTRSVTKAHLEETLDVISRTIKPLSITDQKRFLIQYFGSLGKDEAQMQTITEFVDKLLEAAAANLNDSDNRFSGFPLQTKLLADVFMVDLKRILETNVFEFNDKFDLIDLYNRFLEEKINVLCTKFGEVYREMRKFCEELQDLFALQTVFPSNLLEGLRVEDKLKKYYEDGDQRLHFLQREGVVVIHQRGTDSEEKFDVNFVHRTFAEFLAGKWLYRNYKKEDVKGLIECRFENLSDFLFSVFDRYMARNCPLHLSIIDRNKSKALELLRLDSGYASQVDGGGRTVLHLVSCYGLVRCSVFGYCNLTDDEMVEVIDAIPDDAVTDTKDDLLGYSALEYAFYSKTWDIADKLCQKSKEWLFSLDVNQKEPIFQHCERFKCSDLFSLVCRYFIKKELLQRTLNPRTLVDKYCEYRTNLMQYAREYMSNTVMDLARHSYGDDIGFVAAFGTAAELSELLDRGADVNKPDSDLYTALHYVTIHNRLENAKLLITKKIDIHKLNYKGKSALHLALELRNFELAHILIDEGADVNLPNPSGMTALLYACKLGSIDLIKKTLPMVTNINLQNEKGESAFDLALQNQNVEVVLVLISERPNKCWSHTAFLHACELGNVDFVQKMLPMVTNLNSKTEGVRVALQNQKFYVVHTLITAGTDVNRVDNYGITAFLYTCKLGDVDLVKKMLPMVSDINVKNRDGKSGLYKALELGKTDIAHFLIDEGAEVNLVDSSGCNALLHACDFGEIELVKKILPKVTDINLQNVHSESALVKALQRSGPDVAQILLDQGADVNSVDTFGKSAIFYACELEDIDLFKRILPRTADVNLQNNRGQTVLHCALYNKHSDVAQVLIDKGVDVNVPDVSGTTPFIYACEFGQFDLVKKMLPMVANVNLQNNKDESALNRALQMRRFDVANILIDAGADVNLADASGKTDFFRTCELGRPDLVKKTLPTVTDVNFQTKNRETALHKTLQIGSFDIAHVLIDADADVNLSDTFGKTAFFYACEFGRIDLVKKVLPKVAAINLQNKNGETALIKALQRRNVDIANILIDGGADVNLPDNSGTTALIHSCEFSLDLVKKILPKVTGINLQNKKLETALQKALQIRNFDIAHVLIDKGADVNLPDDSGTNAFFYICEFLQVDLVQKVLPTVKDLNLQNKEWDTALHKALKHRRFGIAQILIKKGADVNLGDAFGTTALHYASKFCQPQLVQKILPIVTDVNLQNAKGESALHLALQNQSLDVVHTLINYGSDVNLCDALGSTPFFYACKSKDIDLVKKMVPKVASFNSQNKSGETALHKALELKSFDIASILINEGADVNLSDDFGTTALLYFCQFGEIDLFNKILPLVTDINHQNKLGQSALHVLVIITMYDCDGDLIERKLNILSLLIQYGINVNLQDTLGNTALHRICWSQIAQNVSDVVRNKLKTFYKAAVSILLQEPEIDVKLKNQRGHTVLDLARSNKKMDEAILTTLQSKLYLSDK